MTDEIHALQTALQHALDDLRNVLEDAEHVAPEIDAVRDASAELVQFVLAHAK